MIKWTYDEMIRETLDYWGIESLEAEDCEVVEDTDADDRPCLIVRHRPTGRTSDEAADGGRWHLDGSAYGDDEADPDTWCVCGSEGEDDPWEPAMTGLADRDAAEGWLRENHARFPEYREWYIDREANDAHADTYYRRADDGALSEYQSGTYVPFAR